MPEIGEVKRAKEIDYKGGNITFVWHACIDCGKERWVHRKGGDASSKRCNSCSKLGNKYRWSGGRQRKVGGYVAVWLHRDDFFYSMCDNGGYVLEHRLVVAKALGRNLHSWEIVHHGKGFAKDDNRYPETLKLVQEMQHNQITIMERKIDRLLEAQKEMIKEIRLLRFENKLLREENLTK